MLESPNASSTDGFNATDALLREAAAVIVEQTSEAEHTLHGADLVLVTYALVGLILVAIWAERNHMPSSLAAVLVGCLFGVTLRYLGAESAPSLHSLLFFDEEMFLYVLLPPIIFEAGFSLEWKHFFNNLATILLFAVVGTMLTTVFIGQLCQFAGTQHLFRSHAADALDFHTPHDAYTFGALISATDPVATLAIMGTSGVDPLIFTLVAGESVLNDAVAIVLVRILRELGPSAFQHPGAGSLAGLSNFLTVSLGSVLVGIAVAAPSALLLKHTDLSGQSAFELSLLVILGYCAYPTAEALHCSGILALFVCAVLMGHYHVHSLTPSARAAADVTLRSLAHLAETFVFMYMGMDLVAQRGGVDDMLDDSDLGVSGADDVTSTRRFVLFAVLVVPLSRAVVIPPLCGIANLWRGRKRSLSCNETLFLVFAGLRGAIAYALARSSASPHQRSLVAATTAVVLFTTFVLGGSTRIALRALGMVSPNARPAHGKPQQLRQEEPGGTGTGAVAGSSHDHEASRHGAASPVMLDGGALGRRWHAFDARVLQPIFGGPGGAVEDMRMDTLRRNRETSIELEPLSESGQSRDDDPHG